MAIVNKETRTIRTDHWQFLLEGDRSASWDVDDVGSQLTTGRAVSTLSGFVVGTGRLWGDTRVELEIHDQTPVLDRQGWDAVSEGEMTTRDQALEIYAPETAGTNNVWRVALAPGQYRWALLAAGLDSVADDIGGVGDDWYRIIIWPGR